MGNPPLDERGQANSTQASGTPVSGRLAVLLYVLPALVALVAALHHGPCLIDDAYITFRYAENLAAGHGIVFNCGEAVFGTTTPLMTILLALSKLAGIGIPQAARGIGIASVMGIVVLIQLLAMRSMSRPAATAVAICLALHPDLAFAANSGMETGLSTAAVFGTLLLALQGRYLPAGLVGGAAFLLRPDGVLAILLAVLTAMLRRPRDTWRPIAGAVLVALPWLIYAALAYGSIVPHSVAAKQLIHADTPLNILSLIRDRLTFGAEMKIVCVLAAIGLGLALRRRSELLLVALWMVLYVAGLCAARITLLFPWYVSPLYPGLMLLAGLALDRLTGLRPAKSAAPSAAPPGLVSGAAPIILLALAGLGLYDAGTWHAVMYDKLFGHRTAAYLQIGDMLRQRCATGDVVLVGEVGAIAYAMPEQVILDSSGINSPAVLGARRADRDRLLVAGKAFDPAEGSPAWVIDVIEQFKPRYVVTYSAWLHMATLLREPRVMDIYRRLAIPGLDEYIILERAATAGH